MKSNRRGHSVMCRNGASLLQTAFTHTHRNLCTEFLQGARTVWKRLRSAAVQARLCRSNAAHSVSSKTLRINADCHFVTGHRSMSRRQGFAYAALSRMQLNRMQLKRLQHALMANTVSQNLVQSQQKPVQHT